MQREKRIVNDLTSLLALRGWYVKNLHGNKFQAGLPDLYAHHPEHGYRWIEVKTPEGVFGLRPAQRVEFPKMEARGVGIWILVAVAEYDLLFDPPNWRRSWRKSWPDLGPVPSHS